MKIWLRVLLIGIIIIVAGFVYGFAGPENEWGSIPVMGLFLIAVFFPWEILFCREAKPSSNPEERDER